MKELKQAIEKLMVIRHNLQVQLDGAAQAIQALQRVCDHDWVDSGHTSHTEHDTCTICGVTRSR